MSVCLPKLVRILYHGTQAHLRQLARSSLLEQQEVDADHMDLDMNMDLKECFESPASAVPTKSASIETSVMPMLLKSMCCMWGHISNMAPQARCHRLRKQLRIRPSRPRWRRSWLRPCARQGSPVLRLRSARPRPSRRLLVVWSAAWARLTSACKT